jgi:hypothetical protein
VLTWSRATLSPPLPSHRAEYERVSSGAARSPKPSRQEFLLRKLQASLWIAFALGVAHFVDLRHVITDDSVTGRPEHKLHRCARRVRTLPLFPVAGVAHALPARAPLPTRACAPHARRPGRGFFKLGLCCFGLWSLIAAYLIVYVKVILNVQEEWDDYAPKAIPVATGCGLLGIISCVHASPGAGLRAEASQDVPQRGPDYECVCAVLLTRPLAWRRCRSRSARAGFSSPFGRCLASSRCRSALSSSWG